MDLSPGDLVKDFRGKVWEFLSFTVEINDFPHRTGKILLRDLKTDKVQEFYHTVLKYNLTKNVALND